MSYQKRTALRRTCLFFATLVAVAAAGIASAQSEADERIEEVTVTGSYIKRTETTGALPIDVVDRNDLEALGAPTTTDIVNDLVINTGSENRSNALGGQNRNTAPRTSTFAASGSTRRWSFSMASGIRFTRLPPARANRLSTST